MNNEILIKAEELKRHITQAVDDIRDSATYINAIRDNKDKLNLALMGAGHTIYLEKVMSNEQMEETMEYIMDKIADAQAEKETRLMMILNPGEASTKVESKEEPKAAVCEKVTVETPRKQVNSVCVKKNPIPEDEEKEYLRIKYIAEGKKVDEIAKELGVGKSWVYDRIKKYKLREEAEKPTWNIEEIKKMLKSGKTVKEIAQFYEMDKKEAYKKMAAEGVSPSSYK